METHAKIIIGACATGLLCVTAHFWGAQIGTVSGASYIDKLEARANSSLASASLERVDVAFIRTPLLQRKALLSGDKNERDEALNIVREIEGVSDAIWKDANNALGNDDVSSKDYNGALSAEKSATVTKCQQDIDTAMDGKAINFKSGSAYVGPANFALLDSIAETLKPCSGIALEIQGHTDLIGNAAINQNMSQARADAVKQALIERGVEANIITAKGYGGAQPIENATTAAANALNRRTVFIISGGN